MAQQARIEGQTLVDILVDRKGQVACAPSKCGASVARGFWNYRGKRLDDSTNGARREESVFLWPPAFPVRNCTETETRESLHSCTLVTARPHGLSLPSIRNGYL